MQAGGRQLVASLLREGNMKSHISILGRFTIVAIMLCACSRADGVPPTKMGMTTTPIPPSPPAPTRPVSIPFPLSEPGPYLAGSRVYSIADESRDGRKIRLTIWYPALKHVDAQGRVIPFEAPPDISGAPYPLILTGTNSGDLLFKSHLASYGFVMVIVRSPGFRPEAPWNNAVIDGPLDFLFALDELTSNPPEGLEGMLDTDRVGVAGYSSDGFFSLALGGARINPEYYFSQCAQAHNMDPPLKPSLIEYFCSLSDRWDEFSSQVSPRISTVTDGLWQPTTDERILAVMPMAPDSAWLYGAEGLTPIHIPTLIIAGTADELVSYEMTSCYVYEHLVNSDSVLISFIDRGHMMVEDKEVIKRINHFAVAFFGDYLMGREDLAHYFSEDFVAKQGDIAWGCLRK